MKKVIFYTFAAIFILLIINCGPTSRPDTEPAPLEGKVETKPVLNVPEDTQIYKAYKVIADYGRLTRKHRSFRDFLRVSKKGGNSAFDPAWFYDSYVLSLFEENHKIKIMFNSAKRAIYKDQRVEEKMSGLPAQVIDIHLKLPGGRTYLLSDSDGDGVLDFALPAGQKPTPGKANLPLLQKMQKKYRWIISILKKSYKR